MEWLANGFVQEGCDLCAGTGLVGVEGETCFDVDDTEFRGNQNVTVVLFLARQVAEVVIGIVVLFNGHFEGGNQLPDPLTAGHFTCLGHSLCGQGQCGRQQCRCQGNQKNGKIIVAIISALVYDSVMR